MLHTRLVLISVAILSVFVVLPAIACHHDTAHGKDTNCITIVDIMIIDSDDPPNQVGIVSPISPLPVFSHNGQLFGLPIGSGMEYQRNELMFESTNCDFDSGDGAIISGAPSPFFNPEVIINNPGNTVYLERPDSSLSRDILSILDKDGTCVQDSFSRQTVIMDAIIDLDTVFVLPFKRVGNAPSLLP